MDIPEATKSHFAHVFSKKTNASPNGTKLDKYFTEILHIRVYYYIRILKSEKSLALNIQVIKFNDNIKKLYMGIETFPVKFIPTKNN